MKKEPGSGGYRAAPEINAAIEHLMAGSALERRSNKMTKHDYARLQAEIERLLARDHAGTTKQGNDDPPPLPEFLLTMLLKPSQFESVTGDLRELFDTECRRLGRRRAVWRYWRRTVESLWPLLRMVISKALKWGAVAAAVKRMFDHSAG
jgi:hypothetical protein